MMKTAAVRIETENALPAVSLARERAWLVQATVAHVYGVALKDLCATTRNHPKAALARQIAMYLCHVEYEISVAEVARIFGRHSTTATYAVRRIEELREDPDLDRALGWLEAMLRRAGRSA